MSAILRVSGIYNALRPVIEKSKYPFKEAIQSRKERERSPENNEFVSTFNLTISEADGGMVPLQIREAQEYIIKNTYLFRSLKTSNVEMNLTIDFMWDFPTSKVAQFNTFEKLFIALCHENSIEIEVSVYACSD